MKLSIKNRYELFTIRNRVSKLSKILSRSYLTKFDKDKRIIIYVFLTIDIHYAYFKVYGFWGVDSISTEELNEANLLKYT